MASTKKGKKTRVKKSSKGGCSTKGGKLYVVRVGNKLTATKSKAKAKKMVAKCHKGFGKAKKGTVCTYTPFSGGKKSRRRHKK